MGGKVSKEEKAAVRFVNERVHVPIQTHKSAREAVYIRGTVFNGRKLLHKKVGEVLAIKGEICAPFMLCEGSIRINGCDRTKPGIFGAECFFNLPSFFDITAITACTVLQLNPKCKTLHLRVDIFELFIRYVPIFPVPIHTSRIRLQLNIEEINKRHGKSWWRQSIAASILDRTVALSSSDAQFDVSKRPDVRDDILEIMQRYNDQPRFLFVPQNGKAVVIQKAGDIPSCTWLLICGTATASGDSNSQTDENGNTITDSDRVAILENNLCMQQPASATYSIQPGSMAVSVSRKTMLCIQFMKAYAMNAADAIKAVNESRIFKLQTGERLDEDKWFKGIIFYGKLNLLALPPGRASQFENTRRTTIERGSTVSQNRKSCRIATSMDYGFQRCGPFDEFAAVEPTIGLITTGVETPDDIVFTVEDNCQSGITQKLTAIRESQEEMADIAEY